MIGPFVTTPAQWHEPTGLTPRQRRRMLWGVKTVSADFTTRGGFQWPFPGHWVESSDHYQAANTGPCPEVPGDGLSVGLDYSGMAQGGVPALTVLIVGWRPQDEWGRDGQKVRVRRCWVACLLDGAGMVRRHGNRAFLRDAFLRGAFLRGAFLQGAFLQGADLRGAVLRDAVLRGACLRGADLQGADLRGADLRGADLRGACLWGAVLRGADLRGSVGANTGGAIL